YVVSPTLTSNGGISAGPVPDGTRKYVRDSAVELEIRPLSNEYDEFRAVDGPPVRRRFFIGGSLGLATSGIDEPSIRITSRTCVMSEIVPCGSTDAVTCTSSAATAGE